MAFKGIKFRLFLLVFSGFVPIILGLLFYVFPTYESFFLDQKKVEIKTAIDVMFGSLSDLEKDVNKGKLTRDQAITKARELFAETRYSEGEYFFAYDNKGIGMAHGLRADIVGMDRSQAKDPNGKNYMADFIKIANAKSEGYVDYQFERKKGQAPEDKISFVKFFEPWGWLVGTGVYLSAVQEQIYETKMKIMIGLFAMVSLTLVMSVLFSNKLSNELSNISAGIQDETFHVEEVAQKLSSISESLSSSTTQQASALQQTSASVEETSAMIERNASNAKKSIEISSKSQNSVTMGKESINRMMQSISEIAESNTKIVTQIDDSNREIENIVKVINEIGDKTKVINDIVFQTKLLSFNASVEAARAGEQGKGFAVVAEEVGNLATMSGKSANEITELLENSIRIVESTIKNSKDKIHSLVVEGENKVKTGTHTAKECLDIFNTIVGDVGVVTQMVEEISTASEEQSRGVREINSAVSELDSVAQQNSSMSQDTSQTADQLRAQVISLKRMTDNLKKTVNG